MCCTHCLYSTPGSALVTVSLTIVIMYPHPNQHIIFSCFYDLSGSKKGMGGDILMMISNENS